MEFTNSNDVIITLNIKDRRGRNIRVSAVRDIKIKVWTHNPDCALSFDYNDIIQKKSFDELFIKGYQMEALPSGVITYQYSYALNDNLPPYEEPKRCHHHHNHYDRITEIITTDIFWRNTFQEYIIESPVYYHTLEHFKDLINAERDDRNKQFNDLQHYVSVEYTNKLDDEIERVDGIEGEVSQINQSVITVSTKLDEEITRANKVDIELFNLIKSNTGEAKEELKETETKLQNSLETETNRAKSEETRIEEKLDAEISRAKAQDTQTELEINSEITRAKGEETRIENKADLVKSNLESEISRAKLVEKDIAESLQTLKQAVETKHVEFADDIADIDNDLTDLIKVVDALNGDIDTVGSVSHTVADTEHRIDDKLTSLKSELTSIFTEELKDYATIEYVDDRLNTIIGTAPEAFDTLGEIADKLKSDDDVFKTINELLTQKALKSEIYTQSEIDSKFGDVANSIVSETQRATLAENGIKSAIEVINGDETTIGSIKHCLEDAKHYADDLFSSITSSKDIDKLENEVKTLNDKVQALEEMLEWYVHPAEDENVSEEEEV